jgi:pimeloyl-ACP methyl ester carboxylesterase
MSESTSVVRHRFVDTRFGQVHLAEYGHGHPVLFLHQTPRSWTEYLEVLPRAGQSVRAIAMDTLGFGQSTRVPDRYSIELFAKGVLEVLNALELDRAALVGHHTGAVIALEVAAANPDRVSSLVLSAMPLVTEERRERVRARPPIDEVEVRADGSHLAQLWQRRQPFYGPGSQQHLHRYIADAVSVLDRVEEGHRAVNEYRMEDRLPLVRTPTYLLCGQEDSYSMPDQPRLAALLRCALRAIPGTGVALPEQRPDVFAREVVSFVDGSSRKGAHRG